MLCLFYLLTAFCHIQPVVFLLKTPSSYTMFIVTVCFIHSSQMVLNPQIVQKNAKPMVCMFTECNAPLQAVPPQAAPFLATRRRHMQTAQPETLYLRASFAHARLVFFLSDTRAKETRWAISSSIGVTPENSDRDPDPGQSCL